ALPIYLEVVADVLVDLLGGGGDRDVLTVVGFHLGLDVVDDLVDLRFVDPGALHAHRLGLAHRVEQGVALTDQLLRADGIENDSRVLQGRGGEGQTAGHIGLDDAGDHVDRGSLGGQDQVDAGRSRQLRDALDRGFHVAGGDHHQVRQ